MVLLFIRNEFCWKACFYVQLRDLLGLTKSKWERDLFARVANTYSPFKGTLLLNSTMNSRMQAICKMVNFCWINIAVCCLWWCLYNLLCCWKMLFLESLSYCFLLLCGPAVLARPEDTYFRGSGDWRLTRMWTRIVFSETYFFEPDRCTHSVVLYSIKLKIMWIMIFTTTKEAGFLVYMSMFAKLIEINYVTLDAVYSWYKRICWGDWWNQRNAGSKTQLY